MVIFRYHKLRVSEKAVRRVHPPVWGARIIILAIEEVPIKLFHLNTSQEEMVVVPKRSMRSLNMLETRDLEKWVLKQSGATFNRSILWIGKQDHVSDEQRSDLTGIDTEGNLIICELKRGTATESAVIQALGYAADYQESDLDTLASILFENASRLSLADFDSVDTALEYLNEKLAPSGSTTTSETEVNQTQVIVLAAEEFHPKVLAICDYLNNSAVALTYWIECWQYELFSNDADNTYVAFNQILPPINVRQEISERRDAIRSKKYVRDPNRRSLSRSLEDRIGAYESFTTARNRGASYVFSINDLEGGHVFSVQLKDPVPWLVLPDQDSIENLEDAGLPGGRQPKFSQGELGVSFEGFASDDPSNADRLAEEIIAVLQSFLEGVSG